MVEKKGKQEEQVEYQPIFKAVKTEYDEIGQQKKREICDIINFEDNFEEQQGLISLLKSLKEKGQKIKVMICITAYNEGADQLDLTMRGIKKNLKQFELAGISPNEIAVIVIFDGIDKMNTNQKDKQENILKMFEILDLKFQIKEGKTMQHQYDEYLQAKADANLIVEEYFDHHDKSELKILKLDARRNKIFQQIKQEHMKTHNLETIDIKMEEQLQKQALKQIKKNGMKYIQDRYNTSWVYQARLLVQDKKNELVKGAHAKFNGEEESSSDSESEESNYKKQQKLSKQKHQYKQMLKDQNNLDTEQKFTENILDDLKESYLNVFFCTKFRNAQKLNSHMWFFKGFCEFLDPKYTILVDTGLEPSEQALYRFFQTMERDKNIGGVCGFMSLRPERVINDQGERLDSLDNGKVDFISRFFHTVFDLQAAQLFEYDISHIVDKAFESLTGFIHVLPGAFSGYRYEALKGILFEYLKTELDPSKTHDTLQEANMFLAEDRILCLDLYCHIGKAYTLKYVPNAECWVDPVKNLPVLMAQRRRWNNGSWYALNYVLAHYRKKLSRSSHGAWDSVKLIFAMYYALLNKLVTFFQIALYFVVLLMVYQEAFAGVTFPQPDKFIDGKFVYSNMTLLNFLIFVYFMIVGGMIYFSLMYKASSPRAFGIWYFFSTIFGIYMIISFVFMANNIYSAVFNPGKETEVGEDTLFNAEELKLFKYMIYITILGYMIPIVLDGVYRMDVKKALRIGLATLSFLFYSPSYIHMFIIYAFCNVDDLSWGTKGSSEVQDAKIELQTDERDFKKKYPNLSQEQLKQKLDAYKALAKKTLDDQKKKQELITLQFSKEKFLFFFKWLFLNIILAGVMGYFVRSSDYKKAILLGLSYFATGIIVIRCIGAVLYYITLFTSDYVCCLCSGNSKRIKMNKSNKSNLEEKLRQIAQKIYKDKNNNQSFINKEIRELENNQKYIKSKLFKMLDNVPKSKKNQITGMILSGGRRKSVVSNDIPANIIGVNNNESYFNNQNTKQNINLYQNQNLNQNKNQNENENPAHSEVQDTQESTAVNLKNYNSQKNIKKNGIQL